jgi:repressor LexA
LRVGWRDLVQIPKKSQTFALQVRGDSMKDVAIVDGDLVIMEVCQPRNADIVAALIDGETTLKRYLIQRGKAFSPCRKSPIPGPIPAQELAIQGVLRALIRPYKRTA